MNRLMAVAMVAAGVCWGSAAGAPSDDARLAWWREARFGLFIHWGLYSTLEGEWNGQGWHAEWIRTTAKIPVGEYDLLLDRFNPERFDADAWCRMASDAGMKYIVITTKHHDGFCLFDSAQTEFDVMSTPFKRDIMAELAVAAARHGLRVGWYHSIMDWRHPDYLPRRAWEEADRPAAGADFHGRFVPYVRAQVRELLSDYGPIGVMWFDGEWEDTWTRELGNDLYALCRDLQPEVIVNNRVSKGREGMAGLTRDGGFAGDFGTPEQEVPATGLPGVDWESCITMNNHWGWNKADRNWKSDAELIGMLCDIASKGGNLLLNVGPKPDGTFPREAVERLDAIGRWMDINGEAIHGTGVSPFEPFGWGRCTVRTGGDRSTLYFHVLEPAEDQSYPVPGLASEVLSARLLGNEAAAVSVQRAGPGVVIRLPPLPVDRVVPVVAVEVLGAPRVYHRPAIRSGSDVFVESLHVEFDAAHTGGEVRYTVDGSLPGLDSPVARGPLRIDETRTVSAQLFVDGRAASEIARREFRRVDPIAGVSGEVAKLPQGLLMERYLGSWDLLPPMATMEPDGVEVVAAISAEPFAEYEARRLSGFVHLDRPGVYNFVLRSDDGSRLDLHGVTVVDNDGLHAAQERSGVVALGAGWHPIAVEWFNKTGGAELQLRLGLVGEEPVEVAPARFRHRR